MKTTKAAKADAHVQAFIVDAASVPNAAAALAQLPAATPVAPTLAVAPAAPAPAAPAATSATMYTITAKAKVIAPHLTLQRGCTVAIGPNWRAGQHKATNTRAVVIETLAELGVTFTRDQALAALKPLKDAAILGSGTPASYLAAFVKAGYLVLGAA